MKHPTPVIEYLSNEELNRLNDLLPWMSFTVDTQGRRFGAPARANKRNTPEVIPDRRITQLDHLFNLADKSILEVGCLEGSHTIGLCQFAKQVYAIDSRIENVVKSIVRSNLFGYQPIIQPCNVEIAEEFNRLPEVDIIHHVGVLYHLQDPVNHLKACARKCRTGLLLDTHYATRDMANATINLDGKDYPYFKYREGGRDEIFSGMYDHAKWLLLDDLVRLLKESGFNQVVVASNEMQRNGPRVSIYAAKSGMFDQSSLGR